MVRQEAQRSQRLRRAPVPLSPGLTAGAFFFLEGFHVERGGRSQRLRELNPDGELDKPPNVRRFSLLAVS